MPNEQNGQNDEVEMLAMMLLIRRFEERASQQYQAQKIGGFCHLYIGQEAVVAGAVAATRPNDYLITAYRDHAHALARGTTADACMAELFGKATGCSGGLGGSMHYFDKAHHMYGGHAIVAAHVPLAAGMAFASKYRKEDRVTLCFFGDGAINQGSFHEALNLAGLFKLPVIFICENNFFAMGTSVKRSTSLKEIVNRARGYDMPSEVVDGMSFREVRDKLAEIIASIRKDPHPAFVEARTYRYRGHSMSDPASYRTKEELEKYRLEDPITRLRAQLAREGKLTNERFDQLDKRAKEAAIESVKFAEESPEPPVEKLYDYVFVEETPRAQTVTAEAPAPAKAEAPLPAPAAPASAEPEENPAPAANAEEFVAKLKRWRADRGYSRAEAGRLLDVPYMTMLTWEHGKHKPSAKAQAAVRQKIESTPPPQEESAKEFVPRLKRWRKLHGYDGKEAATALGVVYGTLLSWERGSHEPSPEARATVSEEMAASPGDETAPPPDQRFLQRLQSWREKNGLSRRQMTDVLEIPEGTLASWEIGQHKPFAKTRRAILEKLEHSAEDLRRRAEAEKKERNGRASESESFLAELKRWREAQKYDRQQAAAALGISFTTLRSWETRLRKPRPEVRAALLEKFAAWPAQPGPCAENKKP